MHTREAHGAAHGITRMERCWCFLFLRLSVLLALEVCYKLVWYWNCQKQSNQPWTAHCDYDWRKRTCPKGMKIAMNNYFAAPEVEKVDFQAFRMFHCRIYRFKEGYIAYNGRIFAHINECCDVSKKNCGIFFGEHHTFELEFTKTKSLIISSWIRWCVASNLKSFHRQIPKARGCRDILYQEKFPLFRIKLLNHRDKHLKDKYTDSSLVFTNFPTRT